MPEQSGLLLSLAKDRGDMDNLENLTGHQDLGRATEGSILQNFWVLQGGSEILPTLQDLGEVCHLPHPPSPSWGIGELKSGAFTSNNSYLSICPSKQSKTKQTNRLCLPSFSRLHVLEETTTSHRVWAGACSCTPLSVCLGKHPFPPQGGRNCG